MALLEATLSFLALGAPARVSRSLRCWVFLLAFLTVLFWDSHRLLALGVGTVCLFAAGVWAANRAAVHLRAGSRLFASSLAEIAQDREALRPRE